VANKNVEQITANVKDIHRLLMILDSETSRQYAAVYDAQEVLAMWEKHELAEVQKEFENE